MMNFLKDWIIQYQNKFSVGGTETTIDRITGTVSQEGDTIKAEYLNEIQKNCIYQVSATRVIEGVLEIYDISIDGSEDFTPFNQTFLIDFDVTNTQVDSLLRFNGITYSLRFSDSVLNGDKAPVIGTIPKRALVKLDVTNAKAIIINDITIIQSLLDLKAPLSSPAFTGTPTTPTPTSGDNSTKIATTEFVNSMLALKAPLSSPAFTGTPTSTTPTTGDNSEKIATTAFVNAMLGGNAIPAKNLAINGYVKMANGLILQWGSAYNVGVDTAREVTFPISFTSTVTFISVQAVNSNIFPQAERNPVIYNTTLSKFTFRLGNGTSVPIVCWFALGY